MTGPSTPVNASIWPLPPAVAAIFVLIGFALQYLFPLGPGFSKMPRESMIAGLLIIACAFGVAVLARNELAKLNTPIMPGRPANALVTSGVFSRSRNPIYFAFVVFLLGLGLTTGNPWLIFFAPLLMIYLTWRVILREEAYLERRFGEDYRAYKRRVRRWF